MCVAENVLRVKNNIIELEEKNQQPLNSVRLLAVSKKKTISEIEKAMHAGQFAFGENYVQEAIEKIQILNQKYENLEWHYIGRIQKNKIKNIAQYFDWVQTIEDIETAEKLNSACEKINKKLNVCVQINISQETQKNGIKIEAVSALIYSIIEKYPNLFVRGLMAIAMETDDYAILKAMFAQLKECYDDLRSQHNNIDTLSMGMSRDMALAIECGSTMVRIGTAIFGKR